MICSILLQQTAFSSIREFYLILPHDPISLSSFIWSLGSRRTVSVYLRHTWASLSTEWWKEHGLREVRVQIPTPAHTSWVEFSVTPWLSYYTVWSWGLTSAWNQVRSNLANCASTPGILTAHQRDDSDPHVTDGDTRSLGNLLTISPLPSGGVRVFKYYTALRPSL